MKIFSEKDVIKSICKDLKEKPLIILGEIHGADINSNIISWLVKEFNIFNIFLELEEKKLFNFYQNKIRWR